MPRDRQPMICKKKTDLVPLVCEDAPKEATLHVLPHPLFSGIMYYRNLTNNLFFFSSVDIFKEGFRNPGKQAGRLP